MDSGTSKKLQSVSDSKSQSPEVQPKGVTQTAADQTGFKPDQSLASRSKSGKSTKSKASTSK